MKSVTTALMNHFQGAVTTLATCWKVTRRDGTIMGFTDHDVSITLDGVTYVASSGYFRSAIANSASTAVDNLEVRGFLDNELISETDLRNGAYDFAEVEIFAVNWQDLSQGICRLRYGFFGEVNIRPSGMFMVELRGLLQMLSQTVGETISPDCRADLGDHRCKVDMLPEIRGSSKSYKVGDRIIVPDNIDYTSVNLPVLNPNFDWYETTSYFGIWQSSGGVIANFPREPMVGEYYIKPTSENGFVRREIPVKPQEGYGEFSLSWKTFATEEGWGVGGLIEFIKHHGIGGTSITVLQSIPIGYQTVNKDVITYFNNLGGDIMVDPEVTDIRITIRWAPMPEPAGNPDPWATDPRKLDMIDDIKFVYGTGVSGGDVLYDDQYQNFLIPNQSTVNHVEDWTGPALRSHVGNVNILPLTGNTFLSSAFWSDDYAYQTLDLLAAGANMTEIDAGLYSARAIVQAAGMEWGYASIVAMDFRNSSGGLISTATTGKEPLVPAHQWHKRELFASVPPLTRFIRIKLRSENTAVRTGGVAGGVFDSVVVALYHEDSETSEILQYGGVEYMAIQEGVSNAVQPVFTHTIGEEVTDGSVVWKCVFPVNTFTGEVTASTDNRTFIVPGIDAPDNYFRWGVLTFLDGANRTRGIEVLSWDNVTKTFVLMLPALHPIEIGTHIRVHAGCDKTRGEGGCKKFSNILNYRGEPEVPGTDQYFKVGGT